jgi:hypothetical protein
MLILGVLVLMRVDCLHDLLRIVFTIRATLSKDETVLPIRWFPLIYCFFSQLLAPPAA